jgi:UDP-glucose:glycoprotein glucosyltransferase
LLFVSLLSFQTSIVAIVDPVTETAQRLSSLLRVIRDDLKLHTTLVLAPRTLLVEGSKIPISSYYRFVTNPSAYQRQSNAPVARFANLPTDHLLTVRMDVPEPWDIQQRQSTQDTDNLRCDLKSGCSDEATLGKSPNEAMYKERHITNVEYTLNHLLFFGHCYQTNLQPPNGLQLTLSRQEQELTRANSHQAEVEADGSVKMDAAVDDGFQGNDEKIYSDTLVMKNVGYWQLRANPGVWDMQIDDNSRGSEIFDIVDGKISKSGSIQLSAPRLKYHTERLVMGDFVARSSTLLVKRRPGFEDASLFYDDKEKDTEEDDVINVFSLATGHLYERFLKIMMLSVTKRTSSKVKFWLFENFLSPSFKASAIAMSKKIGCEVEFVTYKWPEWLRGQSEKQRIIWGYKILFLDVLFPLGVKKIIYVDADQVVRGDLKELWDMDLHGK